MAALCIVPVPAANIPVRTLRTNGKLPQSAHFVTPESRAMLADWAKDSARLIRNGVRGNPLHPEGISVVNGHEVSTSGSVADRCLKIVLRLARAGQIVGRKGMPIPFYLKHTDDAMALANDLFVWCTDSSRPNFDDRMRYGIRGLGWVVAQYHRKAKTRVTTKSVEERTTLALSRQDTREGRIRHVAKDAKSEPVDRSHLERHLSGFQVDMLDAIKSACQNDTHRLIVTKLSNGDTVKDIAESLGVKQPTVSQYIHDIHVRAKRTLESAV